MKYCSLAIIFFILFTSSPVTALESYKTTTNKSIIYTIEQNGAFSHSWTFDKSSYQDNVPFSLNLLDNSPYFRKISGKIDNNVNRKFVFFEHHGLLPSEALVKVRVDDTFYDGEKLYLYYYDAYASKLEYIDNNLMVKNGVVSFTINHCSDYVLTSSIISSSTNNPVNTTTSSIAMIILGIILIAGVTSLNNKKITIN